MICLPIYLIKKNSYKKKSNKTYKYTLSLNIYNKNSIIPCLHPFKKLINNKK